MHFRTCVTTSRLPTPQRDAGTAGLLAALGAGAWVRPSRGSSPPPRRVRAGLPACLRSVGGGPATSLSGCRGEQCARAPCMSLHSSRWTPGTPTQGSKAPVSGSRNSRPGVSHLVAFLGLTRSSLKVVLWHSVTHNGRGTAQIQGLGQGTLPLDGRRGGPLTEGPEHEGQRDCCIPPESELWTAQGRRP